MIAELASRLEIDSIAFRRFHQSFGLDPDQLHPDWLQNISDLFPDTPVKVMSNVFEELQLYDLVELLETGKPRALRPVIPLSEMEKIRNPSYRPTKFCSETEVLLINYSEGGTVGNITQRIGSFFKALNSQSNVTTLEAKGMAELLENLFILKKSMCEGESNDLEEIKTEALLKEHLKEMKAKRVKDTFVWSTMAGRPVRVFSEKTPDKEILSKHLKDVIEKRQQWTNQMKPKLEREIKQNEEELQRKHNKLQITLSAILEKWICYANDEGKESILFVVLEHFQDLQNYGVPLDTIMRMRRWLSEKLTLIPNAKLVIVSGLERWKAEQLPRETFGIYYNSVERELTMATLLELLNKRWQTLDLVSVMQELQRTLIIKKTPQYKLIEGKSVRFSLGKDVDIFDNLSCLPRLQKKE